MADCHELFKPKPSDRSIFRKNIGRASLHRDKAPYLEIWEIDYIPRANREQFGHQRDIRKEREIESAITDKFRKGFCFRFLIIKSEEDRIGAKSLERHF
jgi:hypothetical protein